MKKILLAAILLFPCVFLSGKENSFIYGDVHAMGGYPMVGLGCRTQQGMHAFDISGNLMPINGSIFHAKGQYLFYPFQKGFYLGTGLGLLNEPESLKNITGSFEGALGYQWNTPKNTRIFLEANGIVPFQKPGGNTARVWPGLSLGVGF